MANVNAERLAFTVVRKLVEKRPPLEEECPDILQFQCTIIYPEEIIEESDIVCQLLISRGPIYEL